MASSVIAFDPQVLTGHQVIGGQPYVYVLEASQLLTWGTGGSKKYLGLRKYSSSILSKVIDRHRSS